MWGRTIRVTRLAGFDIKVDASWLLIASLIIWSLSTGYFPDRVPAASSAVLLLISVAAMLGLFASLIVHELAHSIVARHHGLKIRGITLFLFGGVAELDAEPVDATVELRVAIVGPVASLLLAALFGSALALALARGGGAFPGLMAVLGYLATVNLALALFNMIPAFPLDGGRVFRALLWRSSGDPVKATQRAVSVSAIFAWGLIGLGVVAMFGAGPVAGLWPILVGLFLLAIGRASVRHVEVRHLTEGRVVADLMTRSPVTARPDQSLADVVDHVFLSPGVSFAPVVEKGVLLGFVDLRMVRRIDREHWAATKVEDVIESVSDDYAVAPDLPIQDLIERMARTGQRKFLVIERDRLLGVITLSDVSAYLDVSRQIAA